MSSAEHSEPMVQSADAEAKLTAILRSYGASLRRVARSYASDDAETEDLTQDIALAVWRALPTFRGEASERTFVFRIAHKRGLTHQERRRSRERSTPLVEEVPNAPKIEPSADEAIDAERRRSRLFEAIRVLPSGSKSVLLLALEGLSHEEIADVLGSTVNSVGVRLSRARSELRARLGESQ